MPSQPERLYQGELNTESGSKVKLLVTMSNVAQKSNYLWLCLKWLKSQITCDYV